MKTMEKLVRILFLAGLTAGLATGCRVGGDITVMPTPTPKPVPLVNVPTIASPSSNPYYSQGSSVHIIGMCMEGDRVVMSGDATGEVSCVDSTYSFDISKSVDGIYTVLINQYDARDIASASVSFVWIRKTSISPPVITTPATNPYLSSETTLQIIGNCESGATITLSGGGAGSTNCVNSSFSLQLPKAVDGDYPIQVMQTDAAGNSATTTLVWKKHALSVSPSNTGIVVGTSQVFTPSGGSGSYTFSLITNLSGAPALSCTNCAATTYTAGGVSGVTDVLQVTDSLGEIVTANITTAAATADHLVMDSGDGQTQTIGTLLATHPRVQVVDRYGNGIPSVQLYFQALTGDAQVIGNPVQLSDSQGYAEVPVRLGTSSLTNKIQVSSLSGALPDLAGTGNRIVTFTETGTALGTGKFGLSFSTAGKTPSAIAQGDFNGDGKPDFAVAEYASNTIGVFLAKGKGLYSAVTPYAACAGVNGIAAGDFNGDGISDLAVTCSTSAGGAVDQIAILLGNGTGGVGNGTFTLQPWIATVASPLSIVTGDFDQDGNLDMAVASSSTNTVRVHFGAGDGTFSSYSDYTTDSGISALTTADLNGDGWPDLIAANQSTATLTVLLNQTSKAFAASSLYFSSDHSADPSAIATGDLTGGGHVDVAVANNTDGTVSILSNDGTGSLSIQTELSSGTNPTALVAGDFNGDGKTELAVANGGDNDVGILLRDSSSGAFQPVTTYSSATTPVALAASDMNGDGTLDLAVASNGDQVLQIIPGSGDGSFGLTTAVGSNPVVAVNADFDEDGILDLAVANADSNNVTVLKGSGNGFFTPLATLAVGASPTAITAANLNGHQGIVVTSAKSSGMATVFVGDGAGSFNAGVDYPVSQLPDGIVAADFNGDGNIDLAVANSGSVTGTGNSTVSILLGNGDGTFNPKTDYTTGIQSVAVVASDFNQDGKVDLAVLNYNDGVTGNISILLGNGDGTFQPQNDSYQTGPGSNALVAADFDNNGSIDLAVTNTIDGSIDILPGHLDSSTGNPDGTFVSGNVYSSGGTPSGIISGDFNGDGKLDLAVANGTAGSVVVLLGAGNGSFIVQSPYNTTSTLGGLTGGDFNGDGTIDLSVLDQTFNVVQIWPGQ